MSLQTHNILRHICHIEAHFLMTMQPLQHISNISKTCSSHCDEDEDQRCTTFLNLSTHRILLRFPFSKSFFFFRYTATVCVLRCFGTFVVFGTSFWHAALLRNERMQAMQTAGAFIWFFLLLHFSSFVFRVVSMVWSFATLFDIICFVHCLTALLSISFYTVIVCVFAMCEEKRNDKTDREWKMCAN